MIKAKVFFCHCLANLSCLFYARANQNWDKTLSGVGGESFGHYHIMTYKVYIIKKVKNKVQISCFL